MLFGHDRGRLRRTFAESWRKRCAGEPMEPLERELGEIVAMHPEYHALMEDAAALERDYLPQGGAQNPFLHLALHMALHEQLATDRPVGVRAEYSRLSRAFDDVHQVEHAMMECLGEALYRAQSSGRPPDDERYLTCLRRLQR